LSDIDYLAAAKRSSIPSAFGDTELRPGSEKNKVLAHLLMATETIVIQSR
jgi:hypothetical protein